MLRKMIAVVGTLALVLLMGNAAAAGVIHLRLDTSAPEADQVLTEAPTKIALDFSLAPELAVSRIVLEGPSGKVETGAVKRSEEDDTILWASVEAPLADGAYTVSWTTSSGDGHPVRGEFAFTVNATR